MTPLDDDFGPDPEDPYDYCPDCGAGFDEEHDYDCYYFGRDDDADEDR